MAKMAPETKEKIAKANSGLKKLTPEQSKSILSLYNSNDSRMSEVEKIVSKKALFELTSDAKYAPSTSKSNKSDELNRILFS